MKEGTIFRSFNSRDSREVTLRAPKWSDLDDFLYLINSLVEERAYILADKQYTRESEVEFVARLLSDLERNYRVSVVAESGDHVVGHVEVTPKTGYSHHVGTLGISIVKNFRDIGIGKELMIEAENQSKVLKIEQIQLEVISLNSRAIHLYEKTGYKAIGVLPGSYKRDGEYMDCLLMVKHIPFTL
jgi:ribosomal protein S18 acetylase RimI-like enzyme